MEARESLDTLIERCTRPDSPYWAFRDLEGADPAVKYDVEARIDLDPAAANAMANPEGWLVDRIDPRGMVYLRRRQQLTDDAVRRLIADALTIARANNGRFWSWMHGAPVDQGSSEAK